MNDQIITYHDSLIHHGKTSDRIYVMELGNKEVEDTILYIDQLAKDNHYSKIIAKVPTTFKELFYKAGYQEEATIPKYFNGKEDLYFMGKFIDEERSIQKNRKKAQEIIDKAIKKKHTREKIHLSSSYEFKLLTPKDAREMTKVYKRTFETYPFPIFDADYIKETMESHIDYFGIFHHDKLVALSSCEVNESKSVVEMTDFAILSKFRGKKLSLFLLHEMEAYMKKHGIKTAYSMANAQSFGMNITFSKFGYHYEGTLINNANLGGELKSLNIWYKPLV